MMRTALWILAGLAWFVVIFWAGFVSHFPGAALSRYLESLANRDPRVSVRIAPAVLGWGGLSIPQIRVDGTITDQPAFLLSLNDTEIPLSWSLWDGASLSAGLGGSGRVELFWPWEPGEMRFSGRDIRLEQVPALSQLPVQRVQGRADFEGTAVLRPDAAPQGKVRVRVQGLEVDGVAVLGQTIPTTRFEDVQLQGALGPSLRLESLTLRGDLEGSLSGTLSPQWARPEYSPMDLQIDLTFRPEWIQQLGPLAPVAEQMLDQGKLAGTLRGTPTRPIFRNARSRS